MAKLSVDSELIRTLATLLDETGLSEIEFEEDGRRMRVTRAAGPAVAAMPVVHPAAAEAAATPAPPAPGAEDHPGAVKSPMVGTVFLASAPDKPPLVRTGQTVAAGQALMLVEAMKTYNEIKAPRTGTVQEILVENGQPVEYDEVLAIIA